MKIGLKGGAFYTIVGGKCTDANIVDEMLQNEDEITEELKKLGVITSGGARMMTPEEKSENK